MVFIRHPCYRLSIGEKSAGLLPADRRPIVSCPILHERMRVWARTLQRIGLKEGNEAQRAGFSAGDSAETLLIVHTRHRWCSNVNANCVLVVPAAVRTIVPEANPSLYISMALALIFPLNMIAGIPVHLGIIDRFWV